MKYVKFMPGRQLNYASRNKRELQAALENGYDITVVSSDDENFFRNHFPEYHLINDCVVKMDYGMSRLKRIFNIIFVNPSHSMRSLRSAKPDAVSCHDLNSLFLCWLAFLVKSRKPEYVYDSHEFEIGRNAKRNRFQKWFILHLERFLIKKCAFSIMVNDAIADEVQRIHNLKERPIVVRSTPNLWTVDPAVCQETRNELLQAMQSPQETMLMYHGGVMNDRGIEMLIEVVAKMPNVCAVVLGNGADSYMNSLKRLAVSKNVSDRMLFHNAVPIEELWKYVGAVDMGMILAAAIVPNHLYSLPNKFFENIQSEIPVVCPAYPAMQPIVNSYKFGLTCDPVNIDQIVSCVERMMSDKQFYAECKQNIKIAKQDLCWEKEKTILINAFNHYLS